MIEIDGLLPHSVVNVKTMKKSSMMVWTCLLSGNWHLDNHFVLAMSPVAFLYVMKYQLDKKKKLLLCVILMNLFVLKISAPPVHFVDWH